MLDSAVTVKRQSWQGRQEGGVWMVECIRLWRFCRTRRTIRFTLKTSFTKPEGVYAEGNRNYTDDKANTKIFK